MKTCGRHNLESNFIPYSTLLPGYKGEPPARLLETAPASCTIVGSTADALRASPRCVSSLLALRLRYVFHATSPGPLSAPLPIRRHHGVRTAGTHLPSLLGLRQGQLYVAGDSDIRLSRCRKGGMRDFLSLYIRTTRKIKKVREKFLILAKYFFGLHEW